MIAQDTLCELHRRPVGGRRPRRSRLPVHNPATGEVIAAAPLSSAADVDKAVAAAAKRCRRGAARRPAIASSRSSGSRRCSTRSSPTLRRLITQECGKTLAEAEGELKRGIENVEVATGIPSLMMGSNLEDIASGIDELMIRQPVGVVAIITPFNFPGMIPLWFLPYAIACGNTVILKPSEKTPMTMAAMLELVEQAGFPPGVVNLVHGGKDAVDAILDHPEVRAISFVGSTPVARYIYARAAANGKRAQCQGGAKNPIVVLPDADMDMTTQIVADSAFGCAGQRCLASSVVITVAEAGEAVHAADQRRGGVAQGRLRPRRRRRDGAGDLRGQPPAHRRADRTGRGRRRQAAGRRPQTPGRRLRAAATSSGRRCWPTSIRPASWRRRRSSDRC